MDIDREGRSMDGRETRLLEGQRANGWEPDVSFIVSTRNVAPFIAEALWSALRQTGVQLEVIVADNA
jgi:cellulose synthase/poly-beta-1,6-N-acetylglucosamine synthase-like glycosyltransferase